jgi:serine/threonine protein kinase/tetratricopeptide (TPR) repeat protein
MADLLEQAREALGKTYTVERELHGGGMSRVFLAEERQFERKVVIKVLSPELAAGLSAERFEREIKLAAQLQQANIVAVHAAGEIAGLPYYTMPFVEGESLRHRLARGPIPLSEGVAILKDVARALAYAHGKGVVHRDIKPENVLLSGDAAVVTDFGIAKAVSESKTDAPGGTLTVVGTSLGTPAYMAPEQAVGDTVDQRADIYAWGLLAYETLSGSHPFTGKHTAQQWITAQLTEKPAPVQQKRAGLPKGVSALVMRCLEKEPTNRPQTAAEILPLLDDPALMKSSDSFTHGSAFSASAKPSYRRYAVLAGIAAVVLIGGFLGANRFSRASSPTTRSDPGASVTAVSSVNAAKALTTLAVLPFTNTGGNAQDEYFSDGMTDELAHALSGVPTIRVASRTSSYAFKGKDVSPQQIGKTLNVGGIVEGTVRRAGDRIRVTAQLSSATDGLVVWSDSYESKAKDVFTLQDEFTKAIVTAVTPTLNGRTASTAASSSRGTSNPAAYDLYLRGHYFWAKRGMTGLLKAIDYFNRAIEADPKFARAYGGLALAQVILPEYTTAAGDTMIDNAIASAHRTIELDSTVADPWFALGFAANYRMQFEQSGQFFAKALALEPSNAIGRMWNATNLLAWGKIDTAVAEMKEAARQDPLSAVVGGNYSAALSYAAKFDQARDVALRVLEIDSLTYIASYDDLAYAYVFSGRAKDAVKAELSSYRLAPQVPDVRGYLTFMYAAADDWANAKKLRAQLSDPKEGAAADADRFHAAIAFGEKDRALTYLEKGFAQHSYVPYSATPGCDPMLDLLKNEPRYIALMHSAGIHICPVRVKWPIGRPR